MNIYYAPEKFGMELFGEVSWERGYEFDITAVFRRLDDGRFFTARSAGCSCVSPFEGFGVSDLEPLLGDPFWSLKAILDSQKSDFAVGEWPYRTRNHDDAILALLERVRGAA